jgi:hypothetical protein
MKFNQPLELKDRDLTIENLSKLDFIVINQIDDEAIVKMKLSGRFVKLKLFFGKNWLGQILKSKSNGKYYFLNENASLYSVLRLNDWDKIKQFMECLV